MRERRGERERERETDQGRNGGQRKTGAKRPKRKEIGGQPSRAEWLDFRGQSFNPV